MARAAITDRALPSVPYWRSVLVCIFMLSLVVSLATRTFRPTNTQSVTVKASAAQGMRQHMDRDASRFVPPAPVFTAYQAPTSYPYVSLAGLPLAVLLLDESLYKRPPPSC
jgi:hypothetical protein